MNFQNANEFKKNKIRYYEKLQIGWKSLMQTY